MLPTEFPHKTALTTITAAATWLLVAAMCGTSVAQGDQSPILLPIGPQWVVEGKTLLFIVSASDPDGTVPSLTAEDVPVNAMFTDSGNGSGSFEFTPQYTQAGKYDVRFIASDGTLSDTELVTITVEEAGNQPPVLAPIGPKSTDEGVILEFMVSAADPDSTVPALVAEDLPSGATFIDLNDGTGSFAFLPGYDQSGEYSVRFIASDGFLADTEIIPMTVDEAGNQPPVLAPIGPRNVFEGQNLSFSVSASDPDGATPTLLAEDLPANAAFADHQDGTGEFSFDPDYTQAGVYEVRFIASDNLLADTELVAITVENVNRPPILAPIGPQSIVEANTLTINVSATDPDGVIPSLIAENLPAHAAFVDNGNGTGRFDFTPDFTQAGLYSVRFVASDGALADTELVTINVEDAGNHAPVLAPISPKNVTEGENLNFPVTATDLDGNFPALSAEDLPANAVFSDNGDGSGTFDFTPDFAQAGTYDVRFIASDYWLADTQVVPILVDNAGSGGGGGFAIPAATWSRPLGDVPSPTSSNDPNRGVVLGGFGAGSFMYNMSGSFGPWGDEIGEYNPTRLNGAAFHFYEKIGDTVRVRCLTADTVAKPAWQSLEVGQGTYYALQPKGWCVYSGFASGVQSQFFSPIIAHNHRETSYPVAIWQFALSNPTGEAIEAAVMLTWPNPPFNRGKRVRTGLSSTPVVASGKAGVVLKAIHPANAPETQNSEWCIAARLDQNTTVSYASWDWAGDGGDIWSQFSSSGVLSYGFDPSDSAAAIAVKVTLLPGDRRVIPLVIAWDFPVVEFSAALGGTRSTQWWKRYCEYFDTLSDNSFAIAALALDNWETWSAQVDQWMSTYVDDVRYPTWLIRAAFNELYYNQFGGSFWESGLRSGHPDEYMGLHPEDHKNFDMESMVYTLSGNLSVGHYSSVVNARFWPEMERDLLRAHADVILYHDQCNTSARHQAAPEIGAPIDYLPYDTCSIGDPFFVVDPHDYLSRPGPCAPGAVHVQTETSSKFIQRCWRYYALYEDQEFLEYIWPAAESTFQFMKLYDCEAGIKDSLPEAQGYDNTYDGWGMYGTDMYSGAFWVGALEALDTMAALLNKPVRAEIQVWLEAARRNLDQQLWNAEAMYYNIDTDSDYPMAVFADALAGQRYCETSGLPNVLPRWKMDAHLDKVFQICVAPNPYHGARLGRMPDGSLVPSGDRDTYEYWVGTTYYIAAMMYHAGMTDQALTTAYGAYYPVYESEAQAYWFNTPEAWSESYRPRPGTYIPPGATARLSAEDAAYLAAPAPGEAPARIQSPQWPPIEPHQYQRARAVWELMFEVQNAPPGVPVLLRPELFAYLVDSTPTFRWTGTVGYGGSYTLQYARDASFTLGLQTREDIPDTSYTIPGVEALTNGLWYWRVEAVDNGGHASGYPLSPYSFTIDTGIPCDCSDLGDCNGDHVINPIDVVYLARHVYQGSEPPPAEIPSCPGVNGDWNCDELINPVDVVLIVSFVYKAQIPGPCDPCL